MCSDAFGTHLADAAIDPRNQTAMSVSLRWGRRRNSSSLPSESSRESMRSKRVLGIFPSSFHASIFAKSARGVSMRSDGILRQQLHFRLDVSARLLLQLLAKLHGGEDVWNLQKVLQHLEESARKRPWEPRPGSVLFIFPIQNFEGNWKFSPPYFLREFSDKSQTLIFASAKRSAPRSQPRSVVPLGLRKFYRNSSSGNSKETSLSVEKITAF